MQTAPSRKPTTPVLMLLCAMLTLNGCASLTGSDVTKPPVAGASTFCSIAKPITWSSRDTDETIRGVKEHNAVGTRLCHWEGAA